MTAEPQRLLVLVRHGQSQDNERDLFSGLRDPSLTPRGVEEARAAGRALRELGLSFTHAFTSVLTRARQTMALALEELGQADLAVREDAALNERDYGALAGLNKTQARARFGAEQVRIWRKSYDAVPEGGESLAMTAARVWPFYEREIAPAVRGGGRVLVVGHGNALRSMLMRLDGVDPQAIEEVNIGTAERLAYTLAEDGERLVKTELRPFRA
ncbi:2,3-bisphosphoglycerate-dependent phosphoglycerate mutase [Chenggangzhangella methanolivorans]|uniref:2,3-bisphosphoglycerate-dependent phosphoglycerate mutase n=1 Tax=Chenggangzhangella methanolivorans TaxID=1437009 RepID=A0A9E6UH11_9HYPH|nr:2,3-bisphosphoglycerate-dependent phosphoglycerate mutase [Chenggangzhangella methanolivorans]QZN99297.1 2,3-bisphosphoglycerate-dependent phosphoglycerate mutase [Chenggangzhangella methanolivorans]